MAMQLSRHPVRSYRLRNDQLQNWFRPTQRSPFLPDQQLYRPNASKAYSI
jgi:hypothetical protein